MDKQTKSPQQRIIAIDLLRGFALLGILLMNIASFSMPDIAYYNPTAFGNELNSNHLIYSLTHLFVDQKIMAIFSMLFGASVMLLTNKLEQKEQGTFRVYFLRNFWLLIIGLIHSIFIWSGDILVIYALCSFALYFLRRIPPKWQFGLGLFIFLIPSLLNVSIQTIVPTFNDVDLQALQAFWQPTDTAVSAELDLYRGPYSQQLLHRLSEDTGTEMPYSNGQFFLDISLLTEFFLRALGMMLVGMAFYTWGIVSARRSDQFYKRLAIFSFAIGLPIVLFGLFLQYSHNWEPTYAIFIGRVPNHIATPLIASGYIALIMLWSKRPFLQGLQKRLTAVGQTALTNYILQSILGTFIFYGFGLGFFGHLNRLGQMDVVLAIWIVQLLISPWWMARFRYGPLEWLWRTLTYLQWQPMRKKSPAKAALLTTSD